MAEPAKRRKARQKQIRGTMWADSEADKQAYPKDGETWAVLAFSYTALKLLGQLFVSVVPVSVFFNFACPPRSFRYGIHLECQLPWSATPTNRISSSSRSAASLPPIPCLTPRNASATATCSAQLFSLRTHPMPTFVSLCDLPPLRLTGRLTEP